MPIIAEDLGVITPDVNELREGIGAPGMVVLQFAWGSGGTNTHLPHNHYENSVCYPGKHTPSPCTSTHCSEAQPVPSASMIAYNLCVSCQLSAC